MIPFRASHALSERGCKEVMHAHLSGAKITPVRSSPPRRLRFMLYGQGLTLVWYSFIQFSLVWTFKHRQLLFERRGRAVCQRWGGGV